jgi:hypothetical protein
MMKGEQSNWSKLTLGEDEEVEPSLKAKDQKYMIGFCFH